MNQPNQPVPRGWLQQQRAIEKLLLSTKERSLISALYLDGPPTSEFSTSLVDYVVRRAYNGLAPRRVVYIMGTELDMECAASRPSVFAPMGLNDYENILTIKAAKEFCNEYEQGKVIMGSDLVLMIDVRMSATVAEEVMFGLALEQLQQALRLKQNGTEVHVAVLLLGSSWFSPRTFNSFAKLMQVTRRSIHETHPPINPTFATTADLNPIVGEALKKGQRLIFSQGASWNPFSVYDEVDPQSLFSTSTDVVQAQRLLTRCEFDNVQAWAQKATTSVQFFASCEPQTLEQLNFGDEVLGPAWSKDLTTLVLRTIHMMGDNGNKILKHFPMRIPANHVGWADRCRRLSVLGCLRGNPDIQGAYLLTDRGKQMSHLMWTRDLDWEVAWLLMSASQRPQFDDTSAYVLVCMAAIIASGPRSFVAKIGSLKDDGSPYTVDDLQKLSSPCLRHCVRDGMLWLYTGIFLQYEDFVPGDTKSTANTSQVGAYAVISHSRRLGIIQLVNKFLKICGLGQPANEYFTENPLTSQQVASIQSALMWAFLHRIAYFDNEARGSAPGGLPQDTILARDLVSLHDIHVNQEREFLDVESCRAHGNRTMLGGGFFAIYHQLELYGDDGDDQYYAVSGLTWLPATLFKAAERECGILWPEMVMHILD
ncbi:hypothetical protein E0Z10_g4295 [Xylaria hypoxylon]|uniref:Uncharacterized protein n=1 Tax=Xylaria hypoxylon TaxID=37992 RepID=A0A4Z0YYA9_9PEZI|nr:hypothetical protein E0Z10_g4295 [Xylaria hypoxylon]